jgi:beta-glucosidase/6-phospho-beta-glucosidase/beta-galactosidase
MTIQLGWFANPIFSKTGDYPQVMIDEIGNKSLNEGRAWSRLPKFTGKEREQLIGSADFLGLNYYTSRLIAPKKSFLEISSENDAGVDYFTDDTWTRGKSAWLYSVPKGLQDLLEWIKNSYNNPTVIITENGFSDGGEIDDIVRVEYLKAHLASVANSIKTGSNVIGYSVWSIVDNFEWMRGYTEHFGLYAVNMTSDNKERTSKVSAKFMKKLISNKSFVRD